MQSFDISNLGINDGLSQGYISSILQDSRGFMWFGTLDGLNRYDGYHFTVYRHNEADSFSISSNEIGQLFEDSRHRMWVSSHDNGLNYFDRAHHRFYHFFPGTTLGNIAEDKAGNLWIDARQDLICLRLRENTGQDKESRPFLISYKRVPVPDKLPNNYGMGGLYTDRQGYVYSIGKTGIFRVLPAAAGAWRISPAIVYSKNRQANGAVYFLQSPATGKFYLYCNTDITEYSNNLFANGQTVYTADSASSGSMVIDRKNRLWLQLYHNPNGSQTAVRIDLTAHTITQMRPASTESAWLFSYIGSPYEDNKGTIWFKTSGYGLGVYDNEKERFHRLLPGSIVYHLKQAGDSTLSVNGTTNVRISQLSVSYIDTFKGFTNLNIPLPGKMKDGTGNYWYLTQNNGRLYCRNTVTGKITSLTITPANFPYPTAQYDFIVTDTAARHKSLVPLFNYIDMEGDHTILAYAGSYFLSYDIATNKFTLPVALHSPNAPRGTFQFFTDASGYLDVADTNGICRYNRQTGIARYYQHSKTDTASLIDDAVLCFGNDPLQPRRYLWIGTK